MAGSPARCPKSEKEEGRKEGREGGGFCCKQGKQQRAVVKKEGRL
jgi:hypothetical protein